MADKTKGPPIEDEEYDGEPCPDCGDSAGWDGDFCAECGYPHFEDNQPSRPPAN
jgi:hypothetical protein